jgi:hypothetical protein
MEPDAPPRRRLTTFASFLGVATGPIELWTYRPRFRGPRAPLPVLWSGAPVQGRRGVAPAFPQGIDQSHAATIGGTNLPGHAHQS